MRPFLQQCYKAIRPNASILDIGCLGFQQVKYAQALGLTNLQHSGVDYCEPPTDLPAGFVFKQVDLNRESLPFEDDLFDLVVASHVLEHLSDPIQLFGECIRVCKPGGFLYFEAPSERSLLLPGMPFKHDKFFSLSFYDDPTHTSRPWTPQAFYRLTKYYSCEPINTGYCISWKHRLLFPFTLVYALLTQNGRLLESCCWQSLGWASYLVVKKPLEIQGKPKFHYYVPQNR